MKRKHKYRGKRLDGQGWAVGSYIEAEVQTGIAHEIVPYKRGEPVVEVDPETVGEYSGMKDILRMTLSMSDLVQITLRYQCWYYLKAGRGA